MKNRQIYQTNDTFSCLKLIRESYWKYKGLLALAVLAGTLRDGRALQGVNYEVMHVLQELHDLTMNETIRARRKHFPVDARSCM